MAIRMRRGASADLDTARLQSGEIAVATNPDKVVVKTPGETILTLATTNDLALKVDTSSVGANNGIATLDSSGKVPSSQLPSYVDDVIEGYLYEGSFYEDAQHTELITPESSKIYVDLSTDKTYRWSGTVYVDVTGASAWGEIGGDIRNQTDLADILDAKSTLNQLRQTIGYVGVNDMPFPFDFTEITQDGITFKAESDGTITLSGRATSLTTVTLTQNYVGDNNYHYFGIRTTEKSTWDYITAAENIQMIVKNTFINRDSLSRMAFGIGVLVTISIRVNKGVDLTSKTLNLLPVILRQNSFDRRIDEVESLCYETDKTVVSSLNDVDKFPCYLGNSLSLDPRRNVRFSTIKEVLKTYFDNEYISASVEDETLILG